MVCRTESGDNWEVLLPLDSLRRLTVSVSKENLGLQTILAQMPRLHTVIYHGHEAGEGYHELNAKRGTPWLQRYIAPELSDDEDDDDDPDDGFYYDDGYYDGASDDYFNDDNYYDGAESYGCDICDPW